MDVEVVDARPQGTRVVRVKLPAGATLREALAATGFELDFERQAFGIFGKRAALDTVLSPGDRVEIYRALTIDPKEARRRRAQKRAKGRR